MEFNFSEPRKSCAVLGCPNRAGSDGVCENHMNLNLYGYGLWNGWKWWICGTNSGCCDHGGGL